MYADEIKIHGIYGGDNYYEVLTALQTSPARMSDWASKRDTTRDQRKAERPPARWPDFFNGTLEEKLCPSRLMRKKKPLSDSGTRSGLMEGLLAPVRPPLRTT
ncbi:hypothetical protein RB195_008454 [Necator americanus]|uniref:Uncharacterized protein n=1 Tax=Necator americanus TaxID=51031 RepID=A0ABR1CS48_NECAM